MSDHVQRKKKTNDAVAEFHLKVDSPTAQNINGHDSSNLPTTSTISTTMTNSRSRRRRTIISTKNPMIISCFVFVMVMTKMFTFHGDDWIITKKQRTLEGTIMYDGGEDDEEVSSSSSSTISVVDDVPESPLHSMKVDGRRNLAEMAQLDEPVVHHDNNNNLTTTMLVAPAANNNNNHPLQCSPNSKGIISCCGDWDTTNADDWWLHNVDWEITYENTTHYCFSKMTNPLKAETFRQIHKIQFPSSSEKCNEVISIWYINSGFGASMGWLSKTFLKARRLGKPFQINNGGASKKVRPLKEQKPWIYGPKNNTSWAWCPDQDHSCYFLPLSSCPRNITRQQHQFAFPKDNNDWQWQKEYMMRPKTIMRRKLFEMKSSIKLPTPNCITMHIRRADAGLPRKPYRRYAAVQEYLDAAQVEEGANIFLLTDDQTTIDEIHEYHPNYNWFYMDRPRNRGVDGGWEGHIPSGIPEFELLTIFAEHDLASRCEKIVHGQSSFIQILFGKMDMLGRKYQRYEVRTDVSPEEAKKWPLDGKARLEHFAKEMAEYRRKSSNRKRRRSQVVVNQDQQNLTPKRMF